MTLLIIKSIKDFHIPSLQLTFSSSTFWFFYASSYFCDKILSRTIDIWMKIHLVSDSNYNIVKILIPNYNIQGVTNNIRFTFGGGDTTRTILQIVMSKTNRMGDTTYNI